MAFGLPSNEQSFALRLWESAVAPVSSEEEQTPLISASSATYEHYVLELESAFPGRCMGIIPHSGLYAPCWRRACGATSFEVQLYQQRERRPPRPWPFKRSEQHIGSGSTSSRPKSGRPSSMEQDQVVDVQYGTIEVTHTANPPARRSLLPCKDSSVCRTAEEFHFLNIRLTLAAGR